MKNSTVILILLSPIFSIGQSISPPGGDRNWDNSNIHLNDEFSSFDNTKWRKITGQSWWGQEVFYDTNVVIHSTGGPTNSGLLELKMHKVTDTSVTYHSGAITTGRPADQSGFNYPFGYYEVSCQLPNGKGIWPAFWLVGGSHSSENFPCPGNHYEEIDILECPDMGSPSSKPEWNHDDYWGYNWHMTLDDCSSYAKSNDLELNGVIMPAELLLPGANTTTTYHTFAVEWLPDILIFYFDGKPIVEALYHPNVPHHNRMEVILSHQMQGNGHGFSPGPSTPANASFFVDYVRAFRLKLDKFQDIVTLNNQTELSSFDFALRKYITVANNSNINITSGESVSLRATDGITIHGNFTVQYGASFKAFAHKAPPVNLGPAY
jgi:beta-glucanase (GH16 family)